ncbi:MAG TPA: hypothetical protein VF213_02585, partial [Dongiaceae bacterium]
SSTSNDALSDFATAPFWAQSGMLDYVDQTAPTDQDGASIGCGMAFISWLMSQGYGLDKIAQELVAVGETGTFAEVYATLTGDDPANAWPNFQAAVQALPGGVTSDDPFGAAAAGGALGALAGLSPATVVMASRVFAAILTDLAAARPAHQIVGSVRAALCSTRSRRLQPPPARRR